MQLTQDQINWTVEALNHYLKRLEGYEHQDSWKGGIKNIKEVINELNKESNK
jgi:hypothetical protein